MAPKGTAEGMVLWVFDACTVVFGAIVWTTSPLCTFIGNTMWRAGAPLVGVCPRNAPGCLCCGRAGLLGELCSCGTGTRLLQVSLGPRRHSPIFYLQRGEECIEDAGNISVRHPNLQQQLSSSSVSPIFRLFPFSPSPFCHNQPAGPLHQPDASATCFIECGRLAPSSTPTCMSIMYVACPACNSHTCQWCALKHTHA